MKATVEAHARDGFVTVHVRNLVTGRIRHEDRCFRLPIAIGLDAIILQVERQLGVGQVDLHCMLLDAVRPLVTSERTVR